MYVLSPIVICIWSGFSEGSTASSSLCGSSGVPKDVSVKSPRPLVFEEGFLLLPDEPPEVEEDPPEVEDEPPPDDAGSLTVTVALAHYRISTFLSKVPPLTVFTETAVLPAAFA